MDTRLIFLLLAGATVAGAQTPEQSASLARQAESIARQKRTLQPSPASLNLQLASVRKQALAASAGSALGFYTIPWPDAPVLASGILPPQAGCGRLNNAYASRLVARASAAYNLPRDLLHAVITKESAFHTCAVSAAGALGLMQLMPATANSLGVEDPFDPAANIDGGSRYLRELLDRYSGDVSLALAAYNAGPARVDASGGIPRFPETRNYIRGILSSLAPAKPSGTPPSP
jgi:soluble lytic murein transglycosylase-like protein